MEEIKTIKKSLKDVGFVIKGQTCYNIQNDMCFIVFFQKRSDGIINTNLGIILDPKDNQYSYKFCDIGYTYMSHSNEAETIETKTKNILKWFGYRDSIEKIISLYKNNTLCDFISPKARKIFINY